MTRCLTRCVLFWEPSHHREEFFEVVVAFTAGEQGTDSTRSRCSSRRFGSTIWEAFSPILLISVVKERHRCAGDGPRLSLPTGSHAPLMAPHFPMLFLVNHNFHRE
jgi:hypothetical protein